MQLRHFSTTQVIAVVSKLQSDHPSDKPTGFWVSVEGNGDGWKDWCNNERFETDRLEVEHIVILQKDAHILYLTTPLEIREFTLQYAKVPDDLKNTLDGYFDTFYMDWKEVAKHYQGIIIAPYQYTCRLSHETKWYYGWDCASGCIWDTDALKDVLQTVIT